MVKAVVLIFVVSVLFGAVVTPFVYSALLAYVPGMPWPFSRVFDRVAMLGAVILCVIYRRRFDWNELKTAFRDRPVGERMRHLVGGLLLTAVVSLLVLPFVVGTGELEWREDRSFEFFAGKVLRTLPAALLISVIEESFFRVLVFRRLLDSGRVLTAMMVCSAIYATVHFIAPVKSFTYPGYSLGIGFQYLGSVIERMLMPATAAPFVGLYLVGMVLCFVMFRTRSLYLCIGLHAGWVLAVKMALHATQLAPGFQFASPFEQRYFLVSQPYGWLAVALVGVILLGVLRRGQMGGWADRHGEGGAEGARSSGVSSRPSCRRAS